MESSEATGGSVSDERHASDEQHASDELNVTDEHPVTEEPPASEEVEAPATAQAPTRAPLHDRGRTWIALGLVAVALALAAWWGLARPLEPAPDLDPVASVAPTVPPAQVGQVTASAGLPDADPLTSDALSDVEPGWVLATFRGQALTSEGGVALAGPSVLYLVSPEGDTLQVANLDHLGADSLAAWDSGRAVALLRFNDGQSLRSFDLTTGVLGPAMDPCDGANPMANGAAVPVDGAWRLTTLCFRASGNENPTFTSVITVGDRGDFIDDRDAVQPAVDFTVISAGDVQVVSGYHTAYDEDGAFLEEEYYSELTAHLPNGRSIALERPADYRFCNAVGPGRGETVAVHCYSATEESVWELPFNGTLPTQVIPPQDFPAPSNGELVAVVGSCATDDVIAVQLADHDNGTRQLILVGAGSPQVFIGDQPANTCFGTFEGLVLVGGVEGLAWYSPTEGDVRLMMRAPLPSQLGLAPEEWVTGVLGDMLQPPAGATDQGVSIAR